MNDFFRRFAGMPRRDFLTHAGAGLLGAGVAAATARAADADPADAPFAVVHGPVVQSPGTGEVTVTWHTNRPATAAVRCAVDGGEERVFVTSRDGLIPNDSTSHAVRVTGLAPGKPFTYTLVSREFKGYRTPYEVTHGETLTSGPFTCTPTDPAERPFSFIMWNDIHDKGKLLASMFDDTDWDDVDFVVLNGDIINDCITEQQAFRAFYDVCAARFGASLPLVFVRGNHETRGPWARRLREVVPGRGGEYYYSFPHGGAHFVVMDSGEDKPDGNKEYAGLVEFGSFRERQTRWLEADLASEAAKAARWKILLTHQPPAFEPDDGFGMREVRRLWQPLAEAAGARLWLSGHTHSFSWVRPGGAGGKTFHTVVNPPDATLRVDVRPEALRVTVTQQGGKRLHEEEIPA
ncbi:MAG TPA: metallophosphoesterase [Candidatus Hydrogenedentes bacterium]|nr:metallophosphoesterase [Candidatus Hydrogenedentota bacterium]